MMKGGFKWLMFLSHSEEARKIIEKYARKYKKLEGIEGAIIFNRAMRELGRVYRDYGILTLEKEC